MNLSATRIGKHFGLNGQEMNAVLCRLGILEGEPGNYALTELGKQFGRYNYFDNGYGGYAARAWDTISYDESIVDWLRQKMNESLIQEALAQLKNHRDAVKATQIAAQKAFEAEMLRMAKVKKAALEEAMRRCKNNKPATAIILVSLGVVAVGTGIYFGVRKHKKLKAKRELEQFEKDHAMETATNAYYSNDDAAENNEPEE